MRHWYHCLSSRLEIYLVNNSAYTISFNISEEKTWQTQYKKIWNEIESQLFQKMATEAIKKKAGTSMVSWKRGKNA